MAVRVQANWDNEVGVWGIYSDDVPGLHIEADTYEEIEPKAVAAIADLAEHNPAIAVLAGYRLDILATRRTRLAVA